MQWVGVIIIFIGALAGIVVGLDVGGPWSPPEWLLYTSYTTIGVLLVAGIFAGIFSKS